MFLKIDVVFLYVLASQGHPQCHSLYISEGVEAFTLLVIFLIYYDKMFKKINNFLHTRFVNVISRFLYIAGCINSYNLSMARFVKNM